jgi:hypothetical protein
MIISAKVWFNLVEQFCRRRSKYKKITDDGHQVMAKGQVAFGFIIFAMYCPSFLA